MKFIQQHVSKPISCASLFFIPLFSMLLARSYFNLFRYFSSSALSLFSPSFSFFHVFHLLNTLFPYSPSPLEKESCLALSLSTAISCCAGQTVLGQRPWFRSWENSAVSSWQATPGGNYPHLALQSLEGPSHFRKWKLALGQTPQQVSSDTSRIFVYFSASHFILNSSWPSPPEKEQCL